MPTKTEILIDQSNYHRIKKFEKIASFKQDLEPILKKPVLTINEGGEGDSSPFLASNKESEQAILPLIAQDSETTREAKKYVRFKDNGSVELTSASHKGVFRI